MCILKVHCVLIMCTLIIMMFEEVWPSSKSRGNDLLLEYTTCLTLRRVKTLVWGPILYLPLMLYRYWAGLQWPTMLFSEDCVSLEYTAYIRPSVFDLALRQAALFWCIFNWLSLWWIGVASLLMRDSAKSSASDMRISENRINSTFDTEHLWWVCTIFKLHRKYVFIVVIVLLPSAQGNSVQLL